jgi:hypothetical protein
MPQKYDALEAARAALDSDYEESPRASFVNAYITAAALVAIAERLQAISEQLGTRVNSAADRLLAPEGVYVVLLDPDIFGDEQIAWCFVHETDAEDFAQALCQRYGDGAAWVSFQPVAYTPDDEEAVGHLNDLLEEER